MDIVKINNMKKILLILLFIPLLNYGQITTITDVKLHSVGGFATANLSHLFTMSITNDIDKSFKIDLISVGSVAILKETYDCIDYGKFSIMDAAITFVTGYLTAKFWQWMHRLGKNNDYKKTQYIF